MTTTSSILLTPTCKPSRHWRPVTQFQQTVDGHEDCSGAALLRRESRKLSALSIGVWNAAEPKLGKLVKSRTAELALLVHALTECGRAAADALSQAETIEKGKRLAITRI